MPKEIEVQLTLTLEQAEVLAHVCETYVDLGLGNLDLIPKLVQENVIPFNSPTFFVDSKAINSITLSCNKIHSALGYKEGEALGLGSPNIHDSVYRAYEIFKVLVSSIQKFKRPNIHNVHTSGLVVRYTQDREPECVIHDYKAKRTRKSLTQWVAGKV